MQLYPVLGFEPMLSAINWYMDYEVIALPIMPSGSVQQHILFMLSDPFIISSCESLSFPLWDFSCVQIVKFVGWGKFDLV